MFGFLDRRTAPAAPPAGDDETQASWFPFETGDAPGTEEAPEAPAAPPSWISAQQEPVPPAGRASDVPYSETPTGAFRYDEAPTSSGAQETLATAAFAPVVHAAGDQPAYEAPQVAGYDGLHGETAATYVPDEELPEADAGAPAGQWEDAAEWEHAPDGEYAPEDAAEEAPHEEYGPDGEYAGASRVGRHSAPVVLAPRGKVLAAGVAVLAVVAAIVAANYADGGSSSHATTASSAHPVATSPASVKPPAVVAPSARPASPTPAPRVAPVTNVTVYNQTGVHGLAATQAARITAAGWPVRRVTNVNAHVATTTVFYDAGEAGAAQALMTKVTSVHRALPRPAWLARTGGLIVVVARDAA